MATLALYDMEMRVFYLLYKIVVKILSPIPIIGAPMRALDLYRRTKSLEKAGKFEEAQAIRDQAIFNTQSQVHWSTTQV